MNKVFYREQRTFLVWDHLHIIGYLNEEQVENYTPDTTGNPGEEVETPEEWPVAYGYEGQEKDGGTIMPCTDPTNYGDVANGIIRSRYSESQENAIHRHKINGDYDSDDTEYQEYNSWCQQAVATAKRWLGVE